jgi:YVTN family beta-propeller protein
VEVSPDGSRVYVANNQANTVSVIDTASRSVVATIGVPGTPNWIAVTPDGARAYVTLPEDAFGSFVPQDLVGVIDTATNTLLRTVHVGQSPYFLDVTSDGAWAFVTNYLSGTISKVDLATDTVVATIPAGTTPYGIALEVHDVSVDAGENLAIASSSQSSTAVVGTASTAEGEAPSFRWLEGAAVLRPATPVVDGTCPLDLGAIPALSVGDHVLTLEVTTGCAVVADSMVLTVDDSPPTASPTGGGVFALGTTFEVGGEVADFDGEVLFYEWRFGATVLASGVVETILGGDAVALPGESLETDDLGVGLHAIDLVVDDGVNAEVFASIEVEVLHGDMTAPTLCPTASPAILWPPNHKMVPVTVKAHAGDDSGGHVRLSVAVAVRESDECRDGKREDHGQRGGCRGHDHDDDCDRCDGDLPDHEVVSIDDATGVIRLKLRAAREGRGCGRVYTVTVTATDAAGNASSATATVLAPHDRRRK